MDGLNGGWGWNGRDDWQGGWGGVHNWSWSGVHNWSWGGVDNGSGNSVNWSVVSNVRAEGVSVDVWSAANNLLTNLLVSGDGVSGLDGLEDGGWVGDGLHAWSLWDQSLLVDGGQGWHGSGGWNGGNSWNVSNSWNVGDGWSVTITRGGD